MAQLLKSVFPILPFLALCGAKLKQDCLCSAGRMIEPYGVYILGFDFQLIHHYESLNYSKVLKLQAANGVGHLCGDGGQDQIATWNAYNQPHEVPITNGAH